MYRPKKKKLLRRGTVATVVMFAAAAIMGLPSIIHHSDSIPADSNTPRTAGATTSQSTVASSPLRATESPSPVAKYHLVDSSDDASSSGNNEF